MLLCKMSHVNKTVAMLSFAFQTVQQGTISMNFKLLLVIRRTGNIQQIQKFYGDIKAGNGIYKELDLVKMQGLNKVSLRILHVEAKYSRKRYDTIKGNVWSLTFKYFILF